MQLPASGSWKNLIGVTLAERSKMLKEERRDTTAVMGNCKDSISILDGAWNLAYDVSSRVNRNKRNAAYLLGPQPAHRSQNVLVLVAAGCAALLNRSCSQSQQLAKEWNLGGDDRLYVCDRVET